MDKEYFFNNADIFVFPTSNDCFPLVLLEAMQHDIACISTDEGGITEIVGNKETGLICKKNNPESLAESIAFLIDNTEQCTRMGEVGREHYEQRYSLAAFEKRFVKVLKTITE